MNLWFENKYGDRRIICDCQTWADVNRSIDDFIAQCNEAYPLNKKNPFVRYYTRVWEENGLTKIDVGSHTEFFYWEGKYPNE